MNNNNGIYFYRVVMRMKWIMYLKYLRFCLVLCVFNKR